MTDQEYRDIALRISQTFPELTDWFKSLSDEATKTTQREVRKASMIALEASDVANAIDEMVKLPTPPWMGYGLMGKGFAFIAERAREIAGRRRTREDSERTCGAARRKRTAATVDGENPIQANQLAKDLIDAKASGECKTAAETRAWIYARLPGDEDQRDAVHCVTCQNTGCVTVVSTIKRYAHGWAWTTAVASCPCERGAKFRDRRDEAARLPMYDDCEHVRVVPMATEHDLRSEVLRVRDRRDKAKRTGSFDAYNERAAAGRF